MIRQHTIDTQYPVGPVHCYTWERDGELVLFDTGPPTDAARKYLQDHLDLSRLRHVVITHCHVDHYGLADWLAAETGARIYLPYRDALKLTHHERRLELMYALLSDLGFDTNYLTELRRVFLAGGLFPPVPSSWQVSEEMVEGVLGIKVLPCPGHSQSDLVYLTDEWAVTGDTLLTNIFQSPLLDIDLETGERFNNYRAYCTTVVRLAGLAGRRILPGHRQGIESVPAILTCYVTKMLGRVEQLLPLAEERNLAKLVEHLSPGAASHVFHTFLKGSEILFMQDFLAEPELLKHALDDIGLFDQLAPLFQRATGGRPL